MKKSEQLLAAYEDLTWDNYIIIADALMKYDKHEIDKELSRQASIFSYYNGLLAYAKMEMEDANLVLTKAMAQIRKEQRQQPGKQTAKDLDDFVFAHPDYATNNKAVNDITFKYNLIKGLVQALDQKASMLVQLSANSRAETKLYNLPN